MKKFRFNFLMFPLFLLFLLLFWHQGCSRKKAPETPNVLLITLDTTRADYLGCYGSPDVKTPNIDWLASKGVNFMRNIAPSQCTNPSHASILTGLYPAFHGVYDNQTAMADEVYSLAEFLSERGYATLAAVSARHLNPENSNFDQGFDIFLKCEPVEMRADERNEEFFNKLRDISGRTFFAWVHYFDPHGDYDPPAPYDTMYPVGSDYDAVKPTRTMDLSKEKKEAPVDPDEIIPLYKGEITFVDAQIGRLLNLLVELGIDRNTLVVLVADHGESMTEKGIYFCHAGLYNTVTHVPLIMSLPGTIPEKVEVYTPTSSIDIFPTVLDILGYKSETEHINGRTLLPAISNLEYRPHDFIVSEAVNGIIGGIFQNGYKYIKPYGKDWAVKEDHLFRTFADYGEENDLKNTEPEIARKMEALLDTWLEEAKEFSLPSIRHKNLNKEMKEALKALGYIK